MNTNGVYLPQTVNVPMSLYKSEQGKYFVGYADNLDFSGEGVSCWASLYNPPDSGVILYVNVWTAASLYDIFRVELWLNAQMPGEPNLSADVTTTDFLIEPERRPRVLLLTASDVTGTPTGGVKAYARRGEPQSTIVAEEDGKFIFPPGGSFSLLMSHPESQSELDQGRLALGWWEEPICRL